jgi:hypothetical protein
VVVKEASDIIRLCGKPCRDPVGLLSSEAHGSLEGILREMAPFIMTGDSDQQMEQAQVVSMG